MAPSVKSSWHASQPRQSRAGRTAEKGGLFPPKNKASSFVAKSRFPQCMSSSQRPTCPKMEKCPLFPQFTQRSVLRVFQNHFCRGEYARCARYKLAAQGKMPHPCLLPDGDMLPARSSLCGEQGEFEVLPAPGATTPEDTSPPSEPSAEMTGANRS